jgi:hypothetical protein
VPQTRDRDEDDGRCDWADTLAALDDDDNDDSDDDANDDDDDDNDDDTDDDTREDAVESPDRDKACTAGQVLVPTAIRTLANPKTFRTKERCIMMPLLLSTRQGL